MTLNQEHIDFESNLKKIIGLTLHEVEYLEINYQLDIPKPFYKTRFDEIDTVDFSIIFHTNKDKIEFFWDGQFYQYGIGVNFNAVSETATGKKWNVSEEDLWKKFIGQIITDIKLTWEEVRTREEKSGQSDKLIYPQDFRIYFSNNKSIFISAAGFLNEEDPEVMGFLDNLTVTDNESLARQVKMIK